MSECGRIIRSYCFGNGKLTTTTIIILVIIIRVIIIIAYKLIGELISVLQRDNGPCTGQKQHDKSVILTFLDHHNFILQ